MIIGIYSSQHHNEVKTIKPPNGFVGEAVFLGFLHKPRSVLGGYVSNEPRPYLAAPAGFKVTLTR